MITIRGFLRDSRGSSTVKYGLGVGLVGLAVVGAFTVGGGEVLDFLGGITNTIDTVIEEALA